MKQTFQRKQRNKKICNHNSRFKFLRPYDASDEQRNISKFSEWSEWKHIAYTDHGSNFTIFQCFKL